MKNPGPLTLKHSKPDKAEAVSSFVSRFSKSVAPVGRPEGTQDMVDEDEASKNKDNKVKSAKKKRGKGVNKNRTDDESGQESAVKRRSRKRKKSGRGGTSQTE